jgi:hypothetical protein
MLVAGLLYAGACCADVQNAPQRDVSSFDIDSISDDALDAYQKEHPITYEEPSWPVEKLQEFASWLILTFPVVLDVAAAGIDYKDAFDAWWEAHHAPIKAAYCEQYTAWCKDHEPNTCQLHQFQLVAWLKALVSGAEKGK